VRHVAQCECRRHATLFVGIKNMAGDVFLHYTISTYMTVITSADFTSATLRARVTAISALARMMEIQVLSTNIGNTGKDSSNKGTNNCNTVVAAKAHDQRLHLGSRCLHAVSTGLPARTRERTLRSVRSAMAAPVRLLGGYFDVRMRVPA
jgi:hypothetical protein